MRPVKPLFLILLLVTALPLMAAAAEEPLHLLTWGEEGNGDGQFSLPSKVAVDASGDVYIADRGNSRIQKFNSQGEWLLTWGGVGTENGKFNKPLAITVGPSGNIFVTDYLNHRIQKFGLAGNFITTWGSLCFLQSGCLDPDLEGPLEPGDGQFKLPIGIALDGSGNVFVVDRDNHRVQKFTNDGSFLTKWGSQGTGEGQFFIPLAVVIDGSGNVYVSDSNHRVQKFNGNGESQEFLVESGINTPSGLGIGSDGNIYVSDTFNDRVQVFTPGGTFVTKWGTPGTGDGKFDSPVGVTVDATGNIYVVDSRNHRVQKFAFATPVIPVTWGTLKERYRPSPSSGN